MLCWMELFWTIGVIVLPAIAWGVIPFTFRYKSSYFMFASWNLFVALCALPSLLIALWLATFPESPKFLLECGETESAFAVLRRMFVQNTGKKEDGYPVTSLKDNTSSPDKARCIRNLGVFRLQGLKCLIREIWKQTTALCRPPYLKHTALICGIQFGFISSYYTLIIWLPELFYRFEEFELAHPGETASVCDVSSIVVEDDNLCGDPVQDSVFIRTTIIGVACIPTSLLLPLCVDKVGTKFFLVFSSVGASAAALSLYFVQTSLQNLILSCIFEALTSLGIIIVYCVIIDIFPMHLRVAATALSLTFGRSGALLGNLLFGFLIDLNCIVSIIIFAAMLLISGLLCFLLPSSESKAVECIN